MDNRFWPEEIVPRGLAWTLRRDDRGLGIDVMAWDVLGGRVKFLITNVRQLGLSQ